MGWLMKRGDIYFAQLDPTRGAALQKTRPVVIVSNDVANRASSLVSIVLLSSNISRVFPFEVPLTAEQSGLPKDSKAMAQQIRTIYKSRLAHQRSGSLKPKQLTALDEALRLHLGL
jgi:mRNA interferase MazF